MRLMASSDEVTGPVNLGNPGEFTMLELAEKVLGLVDTESKIEYRPLPQDDPVRRKPDISVAQRELGWSPTIALDEGLARTVGHFRELLSGDAA
jgi:UDP-glucuronate decarboxylase